MKRSTNRSAAGAAALIAAGVLSGCGMHHAAHRGGEPGQGGPMMQSRTPSVRVDGTTIDVQPAVLVFGPGRHKAEIVWSLPETSPWRFTKDGIVIQGAVLDRTVEAVAPKGARAVLLDPGQKEIVDCGPRDEGRRFVCTNHNSRPGVFKYLIRLTDGKQTIERDPPIVNW